MNTLKRTIAVLLLLVFTLILVFPVTLPFGQVSAQSGSYNVDKVDHQVIVMYSGETIILDTVHVSGQVTDGFMIGLPYQYSAYIIKALAYDTSHIYDINIGVQLGNHSGFYGAEVNFNGNSPSVFTVAFVLTNSLMTESNTGNFTLDFPAYPSLVKQVETCNVTISLPSSPTTLTISKDDGDVNSLNYLKTSLMAYTYSVATATFKVPTETIQLCNINSLKRDITLDPTGKVTAQDNYRITSNSTAPLSEFVLSLPIEARNIIVRDQFGGELPIYQNPSPNNNMLLVNATLSSLVNIGQSTVLTLQYNLPGANLRGAQYDLGNFQLFPNLHYLVQHATLTFNPPEGATIIIPQANSLDSTATLTRKTYQDTLTISQNNICYVDYLGPQQKNMQVSYDYNPVWVSLRQTFWASFAALIGCIGAVVYRRHSPKEDTYENRVERLATQKLSPSALEHDSNQEAVKTGQPISVSTIKDFIDTYKDKIQLNAELKSLEKNAKKGKIPRRQYKVQKRVIETRIVGLTRSLERTKNLFRASNRTYLDLIRQIELAEADLLQAEENIKRIEILQNKGEISLEIYKKNIGEYHKLRNKAESAINGILQRLHEKIR